MQPTVTITPLLNGLILEALKPDSYIMEGDGLEVWQGVLDAQVPGQADQDMLGNGEFTIAG